MTQKLALAVRKGRTLQKAWVAIHRNAKTSKSEDTKKEIDAFAVDLQTNLDRIASQLQKKRFVFPPARGVKIPKDKKDKSSFRPLVVAKVEARIVQRAIHDVLLTVPAIQDYVKTPHSFGGIKKSKDDELGAVPAAIKEVLNAIGTGAKFIIRSDITSFFTLIPKSHVTEIVAKAIDDDEFLALFKSAIAVELENMAKLREHAKAFPIEDVGVAQGNSLSPLLGNITLFEFDRELNKDPDIRCIRYIDDFIIIAPNKHLAKNTFGKAKTILRNLGMEVSEKKTLEASIDDGFEFLGIEISTGMLRPSKKTRERLLASIKDTFSASIKAFREYEKAESPDALAQSMSLIRTLKKVSDIMEGWAKHYRFCNDGECLKLVDNAISQLLRAYLAAYREAREKSSDQKRWNLLGIEALSQIPRTPFTWPTQSKVLSEKSALSAAQGFATAQGIE